MRILLLRVRIVVNTSNMKIPSRRLAEDVKKLHVQHDLFFLIQPIILLICGVAVPVPVVVCQRGEIRDTETLNLSRNIVSLQVLGRCFAFFTLRDQAVAQQ